MIRFVIPADADPDSQAWPGRPETWRELAAQGGEGTPVENLGSQWCIDNQITGLGFCSSIPQYFESE